MATGHLAQAGKVPDPSHSHVAGEGGMTDGPGWKKALQEPNAIGWIAFLILVLAIGVGIILFDKAPGEIRSASQATSSSGPHTPK